MNKLSLSLLIIFIGLLIYLNRSYAYFYDFQSTHHLPSSNPQTVYTFTQTNNSNPYTYFSLGDSLSAGTGASNYQATFPYLIASKLSTSKANVTLVNLAQPGVGIHQVLTTQTPIAIAQKPDLITLLVGINDIHNLISPADFERDYNQTLEQLTTQTQAKIIVINIPLLGSDKILLPPYNFLLNQKTMSFNQTVAKLATKYHLSYVDLYSISKQPFQTDPSLYSADFFHPSDRGYLLWSQLINVD